MISSWVGREIGYYIRVQIAVPGEAKDGKHANMISYFPAEVRTYTIFRHTLPESTTFAPGSKTRMWYFQPGYDEIVYYAPREEKTWTVHSSCKLTPEPKARVANTSFGLTTLLPWSVYYFSSYPGRKYHIRVFEPGAKVALSARVW